MVNVKIKKDFKGSNHGWDCVEYKEGDTAEISESLYDSVSKLGYLEKVKEKKPKEEEKEKGKPSDR